MSKVATYIALFFVLMSEACVDRLSFDIGMIRAEAVVVEGFITDQPGPYEVRVSQVYNIDTTAIRRTPVEAKKLTLFDNTGRTEDLQVISKGVYQTDRNGIQGVVGNSYKMRVEFLDGRIYETPFDTIRPNGRMKNITRELVTFTDKKGVPAYAYDIYFDAEGGDQSNFRYMWKANITYKIHTNPEDHKRLTEGGYLDIDPLPCSGYIKNPNGPGIFWVKPCECCFCWISVNTGAPVVSDAVARGESYSHLKAGRLPLTGLSLSYEGQADIQQFSLSTQAYNFWKEFRAQKDGIASIFQPATGKVTGNWVQVQGTNSPIFGIFYASSVNRMTSVIRITDLPDPALVPYDGGYYPYSCLDFDYSTNVQPDFWN